MKFAQWKEWIQTHPGHFMDMVRIYLGVGLFIKGIFYLTQPEQLALPPGTDAFGAFVPMVPYVHLAGGLMLALGWLTRLAALAQIPILMGAVLLVHFSILESLPNNEKFIQREGFEFSMLVLFLLILVFVRGTGELSLSRSQKRGAAAGSNPILQWVDTHPDVFLDVIRTYLGVGLLIKGYYIMQNREQFVALLEQGGASFLLMGIAAHYVIPAHFAGGLFLIFGLVTRAAAIVQLPLLLGAVFYVHLPQFSALERRENLEFSALVLFLLLLVTVHGPGRFSVDSILQKGVNAPPEAQPAH
jgi:uncharacterized membrane protein YphA (DoxX/SURF4 family)